MDKIPPAIHNLLEKLSPQQQRLFACDCAEHVLTYFERFQPLDKRPRIAIEVARQYALGKASQEVLDSACIDAEGAAWETAESGESDPQPQDDAAASAAATAEGCSLAELDHAIEAATNNAIEVVAVAAVGVAAADTVWQGDEALLVVSVLQRYREAEAQERAWQLAQVRRYANLNSDVR